MILTHMIGINERIMLTHGQGQGVKGQGQIYSYKKNIHLCKILVYLQNSNGRLDLDNTYMSNQYR